MFVGLQPCRKGCSELLNFQLLFLSPPSASLMTLESLLINNQTGVTLSASSYKIKSSFLNPKDLGFGNVNAMLRYSPSPTVFLHSLLVLCMCLSPSASTQITNSLAGRTFVWFILVPTLLPWQPQHLDQFFI